MITEAEAISKAQEFLKANNLIHEEFRRVRRVGKLLVVAFRIDTSPWIIDNDEIVVLVYSSGKCELSINL
jgi:archaeosine-15-forming tRNA-guanine transglycosylase